MTPLTSSCSRSPELCLLSSFFYIALCQHFYDALSLHLSMNEPGFCLALGTPRPFVASILPLRSRALFFLVHQPEMQNSVAEMSPCSLPPGVCSCRALKRPPGKASPGQDRSSPRRPEPVFILPSLFTLPPMFPPFNVEKSNVPPPPPPPPPPPHHPPPPPPISPQYDFFFYISLVMSRSVSLFFPVRFLPRL